MNKHQEHTLDFSVFVGKKDKVHNRILLDARVWVMATTRRLTCFDLLKFNNVNLDELTETYFQSFYFEYLAKWPEYFAVQEAPGKEIMGYVMGKVEGKGKDWHGHVTAVTVAPEYRRLGLANKMMHFLECVSEQIYNAYFVDLYARESNAVAVKMYRKMGYELYRQVIGYYSGKEDAFDMRKSLARDPDKLLQKPHNPLRVPPGVGNPSPE